MAIDAELARLIVARRNAMDRGDKSLGREIYAVLIGKGLQPQDIDAGKYDDDADAALHSDEADAEVVAATETATPKAQLETPESPSPRPTEN